MYSNLLKECLVQYYQQKGGALREEIDKIDDIDLLIVLDKDYGVYGKEIKTDVDIDPDKDYKIYQYTNQDIDSLKHNVVAVYSFDDKGIKIDDTELGNSMISAKIYNNDKHKNFYVKSKIKTREDIVLKGLRNVGNTCFMNSLIQVLYSIDEFRNIILDIDEKGKRSEGVILNLRKIFNGISGKEITGLEDACINVAGLIAKRYEMADAPDLLRDIIDKLKDIEEVNDLFRNTFDYFVETGDGKDIYYNITDKKEKIQYPSHTEPYIQLEIEESSIAGIFNEYVHHYRAIPIDIDFIMYMEKSGINDSKQIVYNDLNDDLKKFDEKVSTITQYIKNENNNIYKFYNLLPNKIDNTNVNQVITSMERNKLQNLNDFEKLEYIRDTKNPNTIKLMNYHFDIRRKIYDKPNQKRKVPDKERFTPFLEGKRIYSELPTILTIILKRYDALGTKLTDVVKVSEYLNVPTHDDTIQYQVIGIVLHVGAHYVSYVFANGIWNLFDDSTHVPIGDYDALKNRSSATSYNMDQNAYILFYRRADSF